MGQSETRSVKEASGAYKNVSLYGMLASVILLGAALFGLSYYQHVGKRAESIDVKIEDLPLELGNWRGKNVSGLGLRSQGILQLNSYVKRLYVSNKGEEVFVYVGYWKKQGGEHQAAKHSPAICLPSNGWKIHESQRKTLRTEGKSLVFNSIVAEFQQRKMLFNYWFFRGTETYWEEWKALLKISLGAFLYGRSDGGIVEVSTAFKSRKNSAGEKKGAEAVLREFLEVFEPAVSELIAGGS